MPRLVKMFIFRSWQVGAALSHAGKSVFSLTDPYCHLSSTILQLSFIVSSCDSYATKEIPFLLLPHWLFFSAYHSWLQLLLRRINISICKAWITLALHLIFFEPFALILTPSSHLSLQKPLITQPTKAEIIFHHIPCRWLLIWYIHTQIVWEINLCVMAMKSAMSIKQQRVSEGKKVIWIRLCKCSALEEKKRFRAGFDASVIINIAVVYFNSFFYITLLSHGEIFQEFFTQMSRDLQHLPMIFVLLLGKSWKWNDLLAIEKWKVDFEEAILCCHAASHCTSKSFEMKIE